VIRIRQTHLEPIGGQHIHVQLITGSAKKWAERPESHDPAWGASVLGKRVYAIKVTVEGLDMPPSWYDQVLDPAARRN
jgi:hypothetical protein